MSTNHILNGSMYVVPGGSGIVGREFKTYSSYFKCGVFIRTDELLNWPMVYCNGIILGLDEGIHPLITAVVKLEIWQP